MPLTSLPEAVKDQAPAKKAQASITAYEKTKDEEKKKEALKAAAEHAAQIETDDLDGDAKKELTEFKKGLKGELAGLSKEVDTKKPAPEKKSAPKDEEPKAEPPKAQEPPAPVSPPPQPAPYINPGPTASPNIDFTFNPILGIQKVINDFQHWKIFGDWVTGGGPKGLIENQVTNTVKNTVDTTVETLTPKATKDSRFAGIINKGVSLLDTTKRFT